MRHDGKLRPDAETGAIDYYVLRSVVVVFVAATLTLHLLSLSWLLSLAAAVLVCILIFTGIDWYARLYENLYFERGGKAHKGYSRELALAKRGHREEACRVLLDYYAASPDPEALRVCLQIAIKMPVLVAFSMAACQGLLADPTISLADKLEYQHILKDVDPDLTGANHKIGSRI